jgi:serine/threonine protein kinase
MPSSGSSFLDLLEQSHLLSSEQLLEARRICEVSGAPRIQASRLIQHRLLTRWQAQQLLAGQTRLFLGKYKLLEALGRGGMGAVFKAEQPGLGRVVALKVMSRKLLKSPSAVSRFRREIRSAGALSHSNIVAAYDADRVGETYFLVMEFVDGLNLRECIQRQQPLPVPWACECARQTALALQHAFERGMVHRDIKPANLLVQTDEQTGWPTIKVLDFGLARLASESVRAGDLTQSGEILGSPDYIAPEQAESTKEADIRADIFSLGCTLFHLLTGQVPFRGETVMEKLMSRVLHAAPAVSTLRPDVAPSLDLIVGRMLARDPAQRYQTPAEVAAALAPFSLQSSRGTRTPVKWNRATETHSQTVDAQADASLNGFLNQLADHAASESAVPIREGIPAWLRDRRVWAGASAVVVCLVLLVLQLNKINRVRPASKSAKTAVNSAGAHPSASSHSDPARNSAESPERADHAAIVSSNVEREVGRWVLSLGGALRIEVNGQPREVFLLPTEEFHVVGINLYQNREIQDADLVRLEGLSRLKSLVLRKTAISDGGIATIERLSRLEHLNLAETKVSDSGVRRLGKLVRLGYLSIGGNDVNQGTIDALKKQLPTCEIINAL